MELALGEVLHEAGVVGPSATVQICVGERGALVKLRGKILHGLVEREMVVLLAGLPIFLLLIARQVELRRLNLEHL